jgi:hypothetical protein
MPEYDISDELEKDNVEYERKHKKNIRLSVLNEKTGKFVSLKKKGWHNEGIRHGLAARGIRTRRKYELNVTVIGTPVETDQMINELKKTKFAKKYVAKIPDAISKTRIEDNTVYA